MDKATELHLVCNTLHNPPRYSHSLATRRLGSGSLDHTETSNSTQHVHHVDLHSQNNTFSSKAMADRHGK